MIRERMLVSFPGIWVWARMVIGKCFLGEEMRASSGESGGEGIEKTGPVFWLRVDEFITWSFFRKACSMSSDASDSALAALSSLSMLSDRFERLDLASFMPDRAVLRAPSLVSCWKGVLRAI